MACFPSSMLFSLLIAVVAASDEVRRVGITASGKVESSKAQAAAHTQANAAAWSEVSARSKQQTGQSFWRSLRKKLEAKNNHLGGVRGLKYEIAHKAWWTAVRKVDQRLHNKLSCTLSENIAYKSSIVPMFTWTDIPTPRDCALMCAVDPMAERSGRHSSCKSFTYNSSSKECRFFQSGQPAKAEWMQSRGLFSGPPCNLESMRSEIQQTYEADLKQAVMSEQRAADVLEKTHVRLAKERQRAEVMQASLKKMQHDNMALEGDIVRVRSTHRHVQKPAGTAVRKTASKGTQKTVEAVYGSARSDVPKSLALGTCGAIVAIVFAVRIRLFLQNYWSEGKQEKQKPTTNDALVKGS